ncbi:SOS response-associated peptidase family protein [Kribbella sp. NBC_01510]|uniref:SOS response-associated peptidase family protein n=1 Tax=Kribbella sp. NBC_01510 TaxID=2903581 RepID=UPI00386E70A0
MRSASRVRSSSSPSRSGRPTDRRRWRWQGCTRSGTTSRFPDDDPNRVIPTYTIVTTTATDSVGRIHDRMPMAIRP